MAGLRFDADPKAFLLAFIDSRDRIAKAATTAMQRVAADVKAEGAADIKAAGFTERWAKALSARVYPEKADAVDPVCVVVHRIPYSSVFDKDTTITSPALMWLPLPSARKYLAAGGAITPQRFIRAGYTLVSINVPGKPPLLAVATQRIRRGPGRPRKGALTSETISREPVFHGVSTVSIPQKFHLTDICRRASDRLPAYYERALTNG